MGIQSVAALIQNANFKGFSPGRSISEPGKMYAFRDSTAIPAPVPWGPARWALFRIT